MKSLFTTVTTLSLTLSFFAVSCGNETETSTEEKDTVVAQPDTTPEPLPTSYRGFEVAETEFPATVYVIKRETLSQDKIGEFYEKNLPAVFEAAGKAGHTPSGAATGIYFSWDDSTKITDMAVAAPVTPKGEIKIKGFERYDMPASKALVVDYYGGYEDPKMIEAHMAMDDYMKDRQIENTVVIEEYVTDPGMEKDTSKWLTKIYYILK